MNPQRSKILVYSTLALLAAFLFFWLHQEYKDEQSALQNERDLKIAKELFNVSGLDFNTILTDLRRESNQIALKVDVDNKPYETKLQNIQDSFQHIRSKMKILYRDKHLDTTYSSMDSVKIVKSFRHNTEIDGIQSDVSVIYAMEGDESSLQESDSMGNILMSDFHEILDTNLSDEKSSISKAAFKNIWLQILFALFLFSLMTFGIYLLQKGYKEQQLLLENKNNLISNITHELKTPVATIAVALEAIQDFNVKADPKKANSFIDLSRKELNRLSNSIDQVLQLSKMDSKHEVYHFEHQDLLPLCTEVANSLGLQIKNKNVNLNINSNKPGLMAKLDVAHFKSMLFNLIDNSLKYGKDGGQINLNLKEQNKMIELSVSDDGIGINEQYISKLFERFFRVPNDDQHNVKGYGLGLSYVKEIVAVHNWQIDISSKENKGTTVRIKIPKLNV